MRIRTLACLAAALLTAATLVAAPAVPAAADDPAAPRSRFTTPDNSLLIYADLVYGRVQGESVDDSGVSTVMITYCNELFCQHRFEANTGPDANRFAWEFGIPPDGTWQVNVRAVDPQGNMEHPGPEITISVLPLGSPHLALLPLLDQLPLQS